MGNGIDCSGGREDGEGAQGRHPRVEKLEDDLRKALARIGELEGRKSGGGVGGGVGGGGEEGEEKVPAAAFIGRLSFSELSGGGGGGGGSGRVEYNNCAGVNLLATRANAKLAEKRLVEDALRGDGEDKEGEDDGAPPPLTEEERTVLMDTVKEASRSAEAQEARKQHLLAAAGGGAPNPLLKKKKKKKKKKDGGTTIE